MRLVSIGVLSVACLSCASKPQFGGMATKEEIADAYIAALQAKDRDAIRALYHPSLLASLDDAGRRFLDDLWTRHMAVTVDTSANRHFQELSSDFDPTVGGTFHVPVPITHSFQFDGKGRGGRDTSSLVYVCNQDGRWFIVSMIPKSLPAGADRVGGSAKKPREVVDLSPILYSGEADMDAAMAFTGAPPDRREKLRRAVKGELADARHLAFARAVLQARAQRDWQSFRELIHPEGLDASGQDQMLSSIAKQIEEGTFMYGEESPTFFVTQDAVPDGQLASVFADAKSKPTTTLMFYQYYKPRDMLIGTKFFLVEDGGSLKLAFPAK